MSIDLEHLNDPKFSFNHARPNAIIFPLKFNEVFQKIESENLKKYLTFIFEDMFFFYKWAKNNGYKIF